MRRRRRRRRRHRRRRDAALASHVVVRTEHSGGSARASARAVGAVRQRRVRVRSFDDDVLRWLTPVCVCRVVCSARARAHR